jgi:tyrosyl-tRNA synthetase
MQFGGSDQWGNLTAGLELIRRIEGENNAVAMSSSLLLKTDGTKFGKSESGALWLDEKLTSPYEIYQYFYNAGDNDLPNYYKSLTLLERNEIESILSKHNEEPHLRIAQRRLAEEIVVLIHGKKALKEALLVTQSLFNNEYSKLSETAIIGLMNTLDKYNINTETVITDLLINTELSSSNREVREFVNAKAVTLNGKLINDVAVTVKQDDLLFGKYGILRRGKKKYALVVWGD